MKKIALVCLVGFLVGCTDAKFKQFSSFGEPATITCYSGGKVIYEGTSTGKVLAEQDSDGWYFEDAKTHRLMRVSGDCVIVN